MFDLSVEVWRFTDLPPSSRDFKYRDQIRDSSDSAHRNVAEGFGRYNPAAFTTLDRLSNQGLQALARLRRYLRTSEARRNAQRNRLRRAQTNVSNAPNNPNDSNDPNDPNDP